MYIYICIHIHIHDIYNHIFINMSRADFLDSDPCQRPLRLDSMKQGQPGLLRLEQQQSVEAGLETLTPWARKKKRYKTI